MDEEITLRDETVMAMMSMHVDELHFGLEFKSGHHTHTRKLR